jgi:hypothetical protein
MGSYLYAALGVGQQKTGKNVLEFQVVKAQFVAYTLTALSECLTVM